MTLCGGEWTTLKENQIYYNESQPTSGLIRISSCSCWIVIHYEHTKSICWFCSKPWMSLCYISHRAKCAKPGWNAPTCLLPPKRGMVENQSCVLLEGYIVFVRLRKQKSSSLFQVSLITTFCQNAQQAQPLIDLAHSQLNAICCINAKSMGPYTNRMTRQCYMIVESRFFTAYGHGEMPRFWNDSEMQNLWNSCKKAPKKHLFYDCFLAHLAIESLHEYVFTDKKYLLTWHLLTRSISHWMNTDYIIL